MKKKLQHFLKGQKSNFSAISIPGQGTIQSPVTQINTAGDLISRSMTVIMYVVGFLMLIWMAWGIFEYIFAGGDKEKLGKARKRITWAIVGFLIVIIAFTLSTYVREFSLPFDAPVTKISNP